MSCKLLIFDVACIVTLEWVISSFMLSVALLAAGD